MNEYTAPGVWDIHNDMLSNLPDKYDKEPGGFTYDLTRSMGIEAHKERVEIEEVYKKLDVYNLKGSELDRHIWQRKGLIRKPATYAIGEITVKGNGVVNIGDLFETEAGTQFKATEEVVIEGVGIVKIQAVVSGVTGNIPANNITFIPITLQGITEVNNEIATYDGFEMESDAELTDRYIIHIQKPATSGNVYHYLQWAKEVLGVGDARVFPLWNGPNTVKVIVIDEDKKPASAEIVKSVQEYIDPKGENGETWGAGYGEAPIGAYCTVESATRLSINISASLVLNDGYTIQSVQPFVELEIEKYLKEIAFVESSVSFAILSSKVLNVAGVKDWNTFTLNDGIKNIPVSSMEVASKGTVTLSE